MEEQEEYRAEKGCRVDEEMFGDIYDHCLIDVELGWECDYAVNNNIKDKKECKFWR